MTADVIVRRRPAYIIYEGVRGLVTKVVVEKPADCVGGIPHRAARGLWHRDFHIEQFPDGLIIRECFGTWAYKNYAEFTPARNSAM